MEALGISSSQKVGENRIHTLHSLSGWYVDGHFVGNDYALKRNASTSTIVHADVPPARVITVEVSDDKSKGAEGSVSESDSSHNGNMGMNPSAVGNVSHPSPQSNDSGNVGKSGTDAASSESSHYNNSRQSAGIPSTNAEADGSQNEGKRNEGASPQHSGGQGGQSGGYQRQPYNSYQKPNGNDRPDGNK